MTRHIHWAEADDRDRDDLGDFVCTPPPPPIHRAKPKHRHLAGAFWEREVQTGIQALRPPVPSNELLLVGRDDDGIVATSHTFEVGGPWEVKILAAAVALRLRRRGRFLGDALLAETVDRLIARADVADLEFLDVWGLVHPRNASSQALVERNGFTYIGDDIDGYQEWRQIYDLNY